MSEEDDSPFCVPSQPRDQIRPIYSTYYLNAMLGKVKRHQLRRSCIRSRGLLNAKPVFAKLESNIPGPLPTSSNTKLRTRTS